VQAELIQQIKTFLEVGCCQWAMHDVIISTTCLQACASPVSCHVNPIPCNTGCLPMLLVTSVLLLPCLQANTHVDLASPLNDITRFPNSCYLPSQRHLARLEALTGGVETQGTVQTGAVRLGLWESQLAKQPQNRSGGRSGPVPYYTSHCIVGLASSGP
jgi:hypothetical protein